MTYRLTYRHALPKRIQFSAHRQLNYKHGLKQVKINDKNIMFMQKKIVIANKKKIYFYYTCLFVCVYVYEIYINKHT